MVRRRQHGKHATFAALALLVFAACGGQSKQPAGGAAGSAGSVPSGSCVYNGVRYENGETFGSCQQCACVDGGIACDAIDCSPAVAGSGGATGGGSGIAGAGGSGAGSSGAGSSGAGSSGAGVSGGGAIVGAAGGGNACEFATVGSLCVLGVPTSTGQELVVGAPLVVSLRPAGCYSSSCTELVSSSCSSIGSDGKYWVSGFICLKTQGDSCTEDCNGAKAVSCSLGVTLEAGEYTVGIGGTSTSVSFKVPSQVPDGELCVSTSDG